MFGKRDRRFERESESEREREKRKAQGMRGWKRSRRGASGGGWLVTMFGDAPIIIESLDVVCVEQIENNRIFERLSVRVTISCLPFLEYLM